MTALDRLATGERVTTRMVAAARLLEEELAAVPHLKLRAEVLRLELEALMRGADLVDLVAGAAERGG